MIKRIFLILVFCFSITGISNAAIDSISGNVISGSDFGTKTTAAPLIWDNFEDGTNGVTLESIDANWVKQAGQDTGGFYDNAQSYSGDLAISNNATTDSTKWFESNHQRFVGASEVYFSYKYYLDITGDNASNIKNSRITAGDYSDAKDYGEPHMVVEQQAQNSVTFSALVPDFDNVDDLTQQNVTNITEDSWHTIEMYWKLSNAGVADGSIFCRIDGSNDWFKDGLITRSSGESYLLTSVTLGLMCANVINDGDFKMYIDDVYVDNTQSRIVVGNASTLLNSTNVEPQIPTAWATDEITVTYNQGSFTNYETAYLFVIDSDGTASTGLEGYFLNGTFYSGATTTISATGNITLGGNICLKG